MTRKRTYYLHRLDGGDAALYIDGRPYAVTRDGSHRWDGRTEATSHRAAIEHFRSQTGTPVPVVRSNSRNLR